MSDWSDRARPTTVAPSRAKAIAIAPPMPRLAPVTTATFPSKRPAISFSNAKHRGHGGQKEHREESPFAFLSALCVLCGSLPQFRRRKFVHVVEGLVLARHGPNEAVRAGP